MSCKCKPHGKKEHIIQVTEDEYGCYCDKKTGEKKSVRRFTMKAPNTSIQIITYGATITSINVPDRCGNIEDIVLGYSCLDLYQDPPTNPYFGATVGRVANRIGAGSFKIDGVTYNVTKNENNKHTLHGGSIGFDKVNWDAIVKDNKVIMSYLSPDGEEGFPGDLLVNVTFELTVDNNMDSQLKIDFMATTTKPTYVNLTNHSYFNLAGHSTGAEELYKHLVQINADKITSTDCDNIPTGKFTEVQCTAFDLRKPTALGDHIHDVSNVGGYDHNFCINDADGKTKRTVARIVHPPTGRGLEVISDQPGVQFYTSNGLPEKPKDCDTLGKVKGKCGYYWKHQAFCVETQNYPDAINHDCFPSPILNPGDIYKHHVTFTFFVEECKE